MNHNQIIILMLIANILIFFIGYLWNEKRKSGISNFIIPEIREKYVFFSVGSILFVYTFVTKHIQFSNGFLPLSAVFLFSFFLSSFLVVIFSIFLPLKKIRPDIKGWDKALYSCDIAAVTRFFAFVSLVLIFLISLGFILKFLIFNVILIPANLHFYKNI